MQKSIVFGANGYLGRHLVHFLQNLHQVTPLGKSSESINHYENYNSVDIADFNQVSKIDFDVDYIFVFAGLTGTNVGFDKYDDFIKSNEIGLLNILKHHVNTKSKARIIFPSTRLVYKGIENTFLKEDDEKEALTVYAQNKLSCENYLKMYAKNFDVDYTIFRICVPYGNLLSKDYSYGTIGFFLNKASKNKDITLYGKGEVKRTFTHVEDICSSIIKTLDFKTSINTIFNIGSNDNLSLLEAAKLFSEKYQVNIDFVDWPKEALKIESGDTLFDDEKIITLTNYQYQHSLNEWIKTL
ncbi:MAG: NAD(P)-dependent oxidoreductase [Flavobacteriales bacterium]|nr:NAD(P)-dependent oxidoreductase [Flavobacteriales bacterium]